MKHKPLKCPGSEWRFSMLRVFRLNPAFELDINPINVMYIDIKHEDEIFEEYITKKRDLSGEFNREHRNRYTRVSKNSDNPKYLYNYLVLQEKGEHNIPTISDVDVVKSMPGCQLPCTYALSIEDFNYLGPRHISPEELQKVDSPSDFIISIRSIISEHEKLTVDQNEALSCAIAYYYPRPLPRVLLIERQNDTQFEEMNGREVELNGYLFKALVREGWSIQSARHSINRDHELNTFAPLVYVQVAENEIEATLSSSNSPTGTTIFSKTEIPPPLHSELFHENLFVKNRMLACTTDGICGGLSMLWEYFPRYPGSYYKTAYMPHKELLLQ